MDKINVEEILKRHFRAGDRTFSRAFFECSFICDPPVNERRMRAAIKEIVEAVVDKCAEEARTKDIISPSCNDHTPYWGACVSCGRIDNPDIITESEIDKESILQIKQMIDYD